MWPEPSVVVEVSFSEVMRARLRYAFVRMKGARRRGGSRPTGEPRQPEEARRESKHVDFKQSLDIDSTGDWCEVIKDIAAMANSGGGALVIGVRNDGKASDADCTPLLSLDSAKVIDKIAAYTGEQFADFDIRPGRRDGRPVAVIEVQGVFPPLVFVRAGNYDVTVPDGQRKTAKIAFNVGTVYFRHGAKSEPANSHDLKQAFERALAAEREVLMANVRKVVQMPAKSKLQIVPGELARGGDQKVVAVRLTDDPGAPMVRALDLDGTYPFRQKEVLIELNKRLDGKVNAFDLQCVRTVYRLDDQPAYCCKPKYGTRQYTDALVNWLLDQHRKDIGFFGKVRRVATHPEKWSSLVASAPLKNESATKTTGTSGG